MARRAVYNRPPQGVYMTAIRIERLNAPIKSAGSEAVSQIRTPQVGHREDNRGLQCA